MQANGIAQAVLFSCLLMAASVWDLRKRIIPNSICLLIALAGLIDFSPANFLGVLAALPLLIAALLKEAALEAGTSNSLPPRALFWGFWGCVAGLTLGLMASLFFYLSAQAIRRLRKLEPQKAAQASLPMAPFLSLGFLAVTILNIGGIIHEKNPYQQK
jgi:leader peptidase (prepilin peptidase)/N-methyltransferase